VSGAQRVRGRHDKEVPVNLRKSRRLGAEVMMVYLLTLRRLKTQTSISDLEKRITALLEFLSLKGLLLPSGKRTAR
jgi:hypothetical protein